jgi:hypothetical protein
MVKNAFMPKGRWHTGCLFAPTKRSFGFRLSMENPPISTADKASFQDIPESREKGTDSPRREIAVEKQPRVLRPVASLAQKLGTRTLATLFVLLVLFMIVWYTTPYVLRDYLNKRGSELPDYHLNINWVEIHPWNCSLDLIDLTLAKKANIIRVPFYRGERVHIALQWSRVIHFDLLSRITCIRPVVNFVNGPTPATSQTVLEPEWVQTVKQMVPLRINQFQVVEGDLHYYDFQAQPEINLEMTHLNLVASNLVNATHSKALMPTAVVLSGRPFLVGQLKLELNCNVDLKQPTFSEKVKLTDIPAVDLNSFLAKYGSVYAKSGTLDFYSEMVSKEGHFEGYLKPYFQNLSFEPVPKDRGTLAAIWAGIANGIKSLVTNDQGVIATDVPVKGEYKDPNLDFWTAAFGIIQNAYFEALAKGFNSPQIAPAPVAPQNSTEKH